MMIISLFLMAISIPVPAVSASFSLEYTIGFNGHFQLNTWTPVTVFIENKGKSIYGTVEVLVTSGSEYDRDVYQAIYALDVELPYGSKKSCALTVLIKSFTHKLVIRLRQGDNIIISKSVYLQPYFIEKRFAVVADNFPSPDILSSMPKSLFPVSISPKFLPETHYGYESVKLLIMKAAAIRRLRARQYQALTLWIRQGGCLITASGLNYGSLAKNRIQRILPIEVHGLKRLFEMNSMVQFCGQKLTSLEPFLVLDVGIKDSRVLASEGDIPIIIQKNLDHGHIIFLTFDFNAPPFNRWDGEKIFWDKILSLQSADDKPIVKVDDQKVLDAMLANIPAKFPDFKTVGVFIGVYLILLKFHMWKASKPGKQRLKHGIYLLAIVVFFSALGSWRFSYPTSKQHMNYTSFCRLDVTGQKDLASGKYIVGLYSLKKSAYSLIFGALSQPVTHLLLKHSKKKIPDPYVVHEDHTGQQILGLLNRWSHNFYMMNSKLDSPLAGHALRDDHHLTLVVKNKLPFHLVDCLIYFEKRFLFIDDILANKEQVIHLRLSDLKKIEFFNDPEAQRIIKRFDSNGAPSYLKTMQRNLTNDVLFNVHENYKSIQDSLVLTGWGPAAVIQPTFKPTNPAGKHLTMVNWVLPVEITS